MFDDIFEAIRHCENCNGVLKLKDTRENYSFRRNQFNLITLPDDTCVALPPGLNIRFYRGEHDDFDKKYRCVPSLYRIRSDEENAAGKQKADCVLIDRLRIIDFEIAISQFPQVKLAVEDGLKVEYKALAQHYELNTDLLDVTSDLVTAAFFATHQLNHEKNDYEVRTEGIGCIRILTHIATNYDDQQPFRMIGLQPFLRPGLQSAFALEMTETIDFSEKTAKIYFRHDEKFNNMIHDIFYHSGKNVIFPDEEVVDLANKIKVSQKITRTAVQKYCVVSGCTYAEVERIIHANKMVITDETVYSLTRQQRRKLEREYKGRPYGDALVFSRLMYL